MSDDHDFLRAVLRGDAAEWLGSDAGHFIGLCAEYGVGPLAQKRLRDAGALDRWPAEVQTALLSRAGGNPLYAEEFVRMASELGVERELPLPESIQGLIAARLDLLSDAEKSLAFYREVLGFALAVGITVIAATIKAWRGSP